MSDIKPLTPGKILYEDNSIIEVVVVEIGCGNKQIIVTSKEPLIINKIHHVLDFWWVDYEGRDLDKNRIGFTCQKRIRAGVHKKDQGKCLLFLDGEF